MCNVLVGGRPTGNIVFFFKSNDLRLGVRFKFNLIFFFVGTFCTPGTGLFLKGKDECNVTFFFRGFNVEVA